MEGRRDLYRFCSRGYHLFQYAEGQPNSGFERLGVKIRYSYSFVKGFHWLTVIPVNTGQIQGPIAQQADLIGNFGLDSPY